MRKQWNLLQPRSEPLGCVLGRGHSQLHDLADLAAHKLVAAQVVQTGVVRLEPTAVVPQRVEQHPGECLLTHSKPRVAGRIGADQHRVRLGTFRIVHVDERSHPAQELLLIGI
ncbi:hypothetical protein D9M72_545570 [compost metagenome]